jgi:hypothetical protein
VSRGSVARDAPGNRRLEIMADTIPVVEEATALDEAYAMGRRRFEGIELDDPEDFDLGPFYDSASYCNHVLPSLRCLAGYDDRGHGTWTERREIALIPDGNEMDHPADAERMDSSYMLDRLVDEWTRGAYAAVEKAAGSRRVER